MMKIVFIGAGSLSFGKGQIVDVLRCRELKGREVTLALVDKNAESLEQMAHLARLVRDTTETDVVLEHTTDRCEALPGADYVICAVARRRHELWEQDFRIPLSYGFRHCLGENGGPGALFHSLRSLELVIPICRDVERLCPDAMFLNFTNPEIRVLHAILNLTKVKGVGLCHGVFGAVKALERYTGRPAEDFHFVSAGINHLYCLTKVEDKETGQDVLPGLIKQVAADASAPPLFRRLAEIFEVFTFPSDDHIGEYFSFGTEYHGTRWKYGQECRQVHLVEPAHTEPEIADYITGKRQPDELLIGPSGELAVSIICDIELDRKQWREAVNVLNTEDYIENLPRTAVIEVPAIVDAAGIHPQHAGALPEPFAAMIRPHLTIVELLTEAYRTHSRKLLLQALLLDPNVNSIENARKMLEEMLELQREFLPEFS